MLWIGVIVNAVEHFCINAQSVVNGL